MGVTETATGVLSQHMHRILDLVTTHTFTVHTLDIRDLMTLMASLITIIMAEIIMTKDITKRRTPTPNLTVHTEFISIHQKNTARMCPKFLQIYNTCHNDLYFQQFLFSLYMLK